MAWLVTYECRARLDSDVWLQCVRYCDQKPDALAQYNSLLPGSGGSFGPVKYRRITLAEVLTVHDCSELAESERDLVLPPRRPRQATPEQYRVHQYMTDSGRTWEGEPIPKGTWAVLYLDVRGYFRLMELMESGAAAKARLLELSAGTQPSTHKV